MNDGQIIATTTLTMDLDCVKAKSILKTNPIVISRASSISSLSSNNFIFFIHRSLHDIIGTRFNEYRLIKPYKKFIKLINLIKKIFQY